MSAPKLTIPLPGLKAGVFVALVAIAGAALPNLEYNWRDQHRKQLIREGLRKFRAGNYQLASQQYRQAIAESTGRLTKDPTYAWAEECLASVPQTPVERMIALLKHAHQIYGSKFGPTDDRTLSVGSRLATCYFYTDRQKQREALIRSELRAFGDIGKISDPKASSRLESLFFILRSQGKLQEAIPVMQNHIIVAPPKHKTQLDGIMDHNEIALAYQTLGDYESSEAPLREALRLQRLHCKSSPEIANFHQCLLRNLGKVYAKRGENAEAERLFREALMEMQQVYGAESKVTAGGIVTLVEFLIDTKQLAKAEAALKQLEDLSMICSARNVTGTAENHDLNPPLWPANRLANVIGHLHRALARARANGVIQN